jgi:hypothetical protein
LIHQFLPSQNIYRYTIYYSSTMTLRIDEKTDSASVHDDNPAVQLPAYSEADEHSNAGVATPNAPHFPSQSTYMTAEEEKAYLAGQDQSEAPRGLPRNPFSDPSPQWNEQNHTTPPTFPANHDQPRGNSPSPPTLSRGLQVPSCTNKVTSGFPYPSVLQTYNITPQAWSTFTSEITQAAQLTSKDWTITIGASFATLAASGIFIHWLGLIPAVVVGEHLRRSKEHRNLRAARDTGDLEAKLLRWNETCFAPRGFLVRLDLPGDQPGDLEQMDVYTEARKWGRKCGGGWGNRRGARAFSGSCEARRAEKARKWAQCSKAKTAKKGRIVIVPLGRGDRDGTTEDYTPFPVSEKGLIATREV